MVLLNIMKKKEELSTKQAVPDELPSLPEAKPAAQTPQVQPTPTQTQQTPLQQTTLAQPQATPIAPVVTIVQTPQNPQPQQAQPQVIKTLAPDELPPINQEKKPQPIQKEHIIPPSIIKTNEKLYFSEIISRFHNKELSIEDVEKELLTEDVLHNMKKHWEQDISLKDRTAFEKKLEEKLAPLQKMEEEWRALKNEIIQKNELLKEKEREIKKYMAEMREILHETNKLKKVHEE